MMIADFIERFPSRMKFLAARIDFDAKNPLHRAAAMNFFRNGVWDLKFNSKWPCVTVPQTVLMLLAEHACQKELKEMAKAEGIELQKGDLFNLHTHRHIAKKPVASTQVLKLTKGEAVCV